MNNLGLSRDDISKALKSAGFMSDNIADAMKSSRILEKIN